MQKRTLVLGASLNPERYSFRAMKSLKKLNIPCIGIGRKEKETEDFSILSGQPGNIGEIHTVTLYLNAENQKEYYKYILSLSPKRIIFNPGTINPELADLATSAGIEVIEACTLVMLCTGVY
jgi:predicted CoA-binding protein